MKTNTFFIFLLDTGFDLLTKSSQNSGILTRNNQQFWYRYCLWIPAGNEFWFRIGSCNAHCGQCGLQVVRDAGSPNLLRVRFSGNQVPDPALINIMRYDNDWWVVEYPFFNKVSWQWDCLTDISHPLQVICNIPLKTLSITKSWSESTLIYLSKIL